MWTKEGKQGYSCGHPGLKSLENRRQSRTPLPVGSNKGKGPAVFIHELWPVSEWLLWGRDDQATLCVDQVAVADKTASGSGAVVVAFGSHRVRMQKGIQQMCMGHQQCLAHWVWATGNSFTNSIPTKRLELKSLLVFSPKRFFPLTPSQHSIYMTLSSICHVILSSCPK